MPESLQLQTHHTSKSSFIPPLQFKPILKEKIWGGKTLGTAFSKAVPAESLVGESWELSGVSGNETVCTTGEFKGKTLSQLCAQYTNQLTGDIHFPEFPLLYKFIDANERLSVQVHPTDAQAQANGWGAFGKTECWYIVDAVPGAQLICGFRQGVTKQDVAKAAASANILGLLNFIDVCAGDVLLVPGGTVHAILGGVLFYEVQETSDTTFRLYDWNRADKDGELRKLHIPESLEAIDILYHSYHKIKPVICEKNAAYSHLYRSACRHFLLEEYRFQHAAEIALPSRKSFQVITLMSGSAELICGKDTMRLSAGSTSLIPASAGGVQLYAQANTIALVSCVPSLAQDVIAPLLQSGISREDIILLGGNPATSDISKVK
jgi:mannose-6-phosphate isomerase